MKAQGHFVKGLGLFSATNLVIGVMIGSGIFIVPADVARQVGSPGLFLLAWAAAGLMTIAASLISRELAALFPHAGGQYLYLKEAYHPLAGFLYGWTLFTVIQTGTIAAVAIAFAKFAGVLFPFISESTVAFHAGALTLSTQKVTAIVVILALTLTNCHSLRVGRNIQNAFTVTKVLTLVAIIVIGFTLSADNRLLNVASWWQAADRPSAGWGLWWMFAIALVGPLFSSDAWNNVTFAGDEVQSASATLPRALARGTATVVALYVLVNMAYLNLLPIGAIQNAPEDRVAIAAVSTILGGSAAWVMAAVIMVSTFGCINGMILSGARLCYAMARDGLFFRIAGKLGERSGVPQAGLVLQGLWACALALSGTYGDLLDYVIFAAVLFYLLTAVGVIILRRKMPDAPRPSRVPWYPFLPALYIAASSLFLVALLWKKPMYTWPGLIIVISGVPVYFIWRAVAGCPPAERS